MIVDVFRGKDPYQAGIEESFKIPTKLSPEYEVNRLVRRHYYFIEQKEKFLKFNRDQEYAKTVQSQIQKHRDFIRGLTEIKFH